MVGVGTVLADDPQLDVRHLKGRNPRVAVVDSILRTPLNARLFSCRPADQIIFYTTRHASENRRKTFEKMGVRVMIADGAQGKVSLKKVLRDLGRRRLTNVMVEGGPRLVGEFLRNKLADRVVVFVGARLIGGSKAPGAWEGQGVSAMKMARPLKDVSFRVLGDNVMIEGTLS
jgi:diaminohydroxyphosphoribosylaminopyrimidine deaminase/5-amino-6-(5-phosphoribosylamino)uracil reductase